MTTVEVFSTPHSRPLYMEVRADTSDWNTVNAISGIHDEYHLPEGLSGWALDVGAHIGAAAICLALDNPDLRVIAIEALPENVELLRRNVERNRVQDRVTVLEGGAGDGSAVRVGYGADGVHDFIGNTWAPEENRSVTVPGFSLEGILAQFDIYRIAWMKIDCEGCEAPFLESPAIGRVDHIEGEVHPQAGGANLRRILEGTHDVSFPREAANPDFGPFVATIR